MGNRKEFEKYLEGHPKPDVGLEEERRILREEVVNAVKEIASEQNADVDISNLFDIFLKKSTAHKKSVFYGGETKEVENNSFLAERAFWDAVGDGLKENVFKEVYGKILPKIENGEYNKAEELITEELRRTVKSISPTLYRGQDRLAIALTELKRKFYEIFPEVKALIYGAAKHKQENEWAENAALTGESSEKKQNPAESGGEGDKYEYLQMNRNWAVPDLGEIKPGLIIELKNAEGGQEAIEVLSEPFDDGGNLTIKVQYLGYASPIMVLLENIGLVPIKSGLKGFWDSRVIPVKWYMKKEVG